MTSFVYVDLPNCVLAVFAFAFALGSNGLIASSAHAQKPSCAQNAPPLQTTLTCADDHDLNHIDPTGHRIKRMD
jgi:hypothetical protein